MDWANSIGLLGDVLFLVSYYLLQTKYYTYNNLNYLCLNLFGALFLLISLCYHWNLPAFCIEVAWVVISVFGVYRAILSTSAEVY